VPLDNYQLLVGRPIAWELDDDDNPHIEIRVVENDRDHRIALNVRSKLSPHALLYRRVDPFTPSTIGDLESVSHGVFDLRNTHQDLALDYVHNGLVTKEEMSIAPYEVSGANNDLKDYLVPLFEEAITTNATIYAFGETWYEPGEADRYFDFQPGRGIHDIHMNQGSTGQFQATNGPAQDGALIVQLPDRWIAIFLAFQSQSWDTDPATGHPRSAPEPRPPIGRSPHLDAVIQITAALINAANPEEGNETVTLINRSDTTIDLTGWQLHDKNNRTQQLTGTLNPGDTHRATLDAHDTNAMRLSNKGGTITLANNEHETVHAATYTKQDVGPDGWTTLF